MELPIVQLIEQAAPDIYKAYVFKEQNQAFDKFRRLEGIHQQIFEKLNVLTHLNGNSSNFMNARTEIQKTLNQSIIKSYLQPYEIQLVQQSVQTVFLSLEILLETKTHEFPILLAELQKTVEKYSANYEEQESFITKFFLTPFCDAALAVCKSLDHEAKGRFIANIAPKARSTALLEKR